MVLSLINKNGKVKIMTNKTEDKKTTKDMVNHWLGHRFINGSSSDCLEWLPNFMVNLINKKFTVDEVEKEIQDMYKNYILDGYSKKDIKNIYKNHIKEEI